MDVTWPLYEKRGIKIPLMTSICYLKYPPLHFMMIMFWSDMFYYSQVDNKRNTLKLQYSETMLFT